MPEHGSSLAQLDGGIDGERRPKDWLGSRIFLAGMFSESFLFLPNLHKGQTRRLACICSCLAA